MARKVYVRDLNILLDLDRSLGAFASHAQEVLVRVGKEVRASKEWLAERRRYWSREVQRRRQAYEICLRQRDKEDYGGGCGAEAAALREAEEALELARRWSVRVEQAIGEYAPHEERISQMVRSRVNNARASLSRSIAKYRSHLVGPPIDMPIHPSPGGDSVATEANPTIPETREEVTKDQPTPDQVGITWAEHRALVDRMLAGESLTLDDLKKLESPISDFKAGTLVEDDAWIRGVLEADAYREAMRDSYEAHNNRGPQYAIWEAILAYLKAKGYWRSK